MIEFHKEEDHGRAFALLFNSCQDIETKFKQRTSLPYSIIKDKEEKRISSMLATAGEIGAQFYYLQTAAISVVALAKDV